MKKSLFIASFLGAVLSLAAVSIPVVSFAQPYYGSYSTYGTSQGCLDLTTYQQYASTDAVTGGQVSLLQEFLNQTGYLSGVSGTYDAGTVGAVINYQNAHGIQPTGTVGPVTMSAINAQSCQNGSGYNGYTNGYTSSYPVTAYGNGSNCYWTGTYNSTYVCRTSGTPVVYPVSNPNPIVCNSNGYYGNGSYNNSYNYGYNNGYNNNQNCGNYGYVQLNSLSASYNYNTATITLSGYGFSTSGNTVDFGNTVISNVYSSNGTTLTFSVPTGYSYGTYSITATNAQGRSSNALSFALNNGNYYGNGYNNGGYNNCSNGYNTNTYYNNNNCYSNVAPTLSTISGPSNIQYGTTSTWNVSVTNGSTAYVTLNANWGDGSTSVSNSQNTNTYNNSNYSFTHEYRTPGTYTLRITATSSNGQNAYMTEVITVTGSNGYSYNYGYNY